MIDQDASSTSAPIRHFTLFDNWGLELSNALISKGCDFGPCMELDAGYRHAPEIHTRLGREFIAAASLAHLIEAVVLQGGVYYPRAEYSWWHKTAEYGLSSIVDFIEPIDVEFSDAEQAERTAIYATNDSTDLAAFQSSKFSTSESGPPQYSSVVTAGAVTYLLLASRAGLCYQPCPLRADFLLKAGLATVSKKTFQSHFLKLVDEERTKLCYEINEEMGDDLLAAPYSGVATYIFANCSHAKDIPTLVAELRCRDSTRAFRQWLLSVEKEWERGNVSAIVKEIRKVKDVFADVRSSFGMEKLDAGQLTIGWLPSYSVPFTTLKSIFGLRSPLPLAFIRTIGSHVVLAESYADSMSRLFGMSSLHRANLRESWWRSSH